MLLSSFCIVIFYSVISLLFTTIVATSLVSLAASLNPPLEPPCRCCWWNRWQVAGVAFKSSPSSGCYLALWDTDSSLSELTLMPFPSKVAFLKVFSWQMGFLGILSSRTTHFLQRQKAHLKYTLWPAFSLDFSWLNVWFSTNSANLLTSFYFRDNIDNS